MSVVGAAIGKNKHINLCDFDGVKKKELERRKKLRLEQVRLQSKELSMQIRDRVAREKHRQLRNIEEVKKKELLSWKEQHVNNTMADYYYCLSNVGDAHVAAERENELTEYLDIQQRGNRKVAVMRGRKALQKERSKTVKKTERLVKRNPKVKFVHKNLLNAPPQARDEENDRVLSEDDENLLSESDDESIAGIIDPISGSTTGSPDTHLSEQIDKQKDVVRFSQVSDLVEERRRARSLCDQMLESLGTSVPETFSKSPEASTKSPQEKLLFAPKSPKRITKPPGQKTLAAVRELKPKSPRKETLCAPKSPKHLTKSSVQKSPVAIRGLVPKPDQREQLHAPKSPKHVTKSPVQKSPVAIRGLVPKPDQREQLHAPKSPKHVTKSPVQNTHVPKQHQFSRFDQATAGNQNINSQRRVIANTKKINIPNKVVKTKNIVTSKFASPQRREFVPRFTKNPVAAPGILKNKDAPVITATDTIKSPEKVHFYDHFSRSGKDYDAIPGIVIRESHPPTINANEAARVQNEMDEIRFQQMLELSRKSEQRSKEALQKNQVRKDYENLTKELDELCKEENRLRTVAMPNEQFSEERISQLARSRQQNMNRAFEDIYQKPVVITCPPISSNRNSNSSDFNVATSPSSDKQQQRIDPFDSSDSCTSILLGYVDNRSRKLVKDIKQCKDDPDGDKRKKLVTLLTRLDHLRKLLMEEIVRNSSLNLEPFYRSVMEVETEKKEILFDSDANKENMKKQAERLKKREDTVKSQERKLEKKIAELFRKEQGNAIQPGDDTTFESIASETITSATDHSEPVKILIEVKNAGKIRKSRYPKKVHTASHDVGPESQHKTSVGSSASTAYRSPPRTFQTDFTKVLSNQAAAKPTKASSKATTMTNTVQQTPLAHYITRLLGMSQQSIDQLGVSSSSSIATPTDSVIDVPENMSSAVIDRQHLNRIQMKIDENLRFSKEVDDSFKQSKNQTEVKNATKTIREREAKFEKERQNQTKGQAKSQKNELKKLRSDAISTLPEKSKKLTNKIQQKAGLIDKGHINEAVIQPNIPENSKRIIADLTKQIEQVRQAKQKMLEKTLSSVHSSNSSSGKEFDCTEYKDFVTPSKSKSKQPADENNCSSQASDVVSSPGQFIDEGSKNLINTKQIGISFSRDSGIGSSRPVTSTDFRISPDIKPTEKTTMTQTSKGINTDTPVRSDPSAGPADNNGKSVESSRKSAKPPISLKRYSPQLLAEPLQPHDLSTINEVETSAASRFNQSTRNEISDLSVPVPYAKFPTFGEYAKMQEITSVDTSSDGDKSYSATVLKKMLEVSCLSETDLNYRRLNKSHPMNNTNEKSTSTDIGSEYIDVEKEIKERRLMEAEDIFTSSTSSKILSSSTSSDLLAKDFNRIGLTWASAMLKKTSTAQNLESSSSSIKSTSIGPTKMSGGSSPDDRINGNPLNIRDFLARELLKRSQLSTSSSISDNSTLTDQFLKSLLSISTNSSLQQQATLRTSTPNRINLSSESEKFVAAHDVGHTAKDEHLFSGESVISSVRGMSQSETSGARETSE